MTAPAQHTPGPWTYRTHPNDFAFEHIANEHGAIVAKPMRMGGNGAMEANARLIAAAPELLEVAKEGLLCVLADINDRERELNNREFKPDFEGDTLLKVYRERADRFRATIAKAGGTA